MIVRHRDAELVVRGEAHRLADEIAVVDDVVVGQRRALRHARGAGCELDVDRVVELQRRAENRQRLTLDVARRARDVVKIEHARCRLGPEADDDLEVRQPRRLDAAERGAVDLGRDCAERSEIVVRLVAGAQDQRAAAGFFHGVFELVHPVGRVDVGEDEAGKGSAELREHPFAAIGRPDPDPLALLQSERPQADGQVLGAAQKLGVGPADVLVAGDLGGPARPFGRDPPQERADRLAEEWRLADAMDIGLGQ